MVTAVLAAGLAAACAKVAPPPGGAEDVEPPQIVLDAVQPPPGAAGVDPAQPVMIVFSERPDRRSVMRALRIWPRVDFRDVQWDADTLRLVPDPAWATERGTLLRISRRAEDRRGNTLAVAFLLPFTTRAVPDSGEIAGRAWPGREHELNQPIVLLAFDAADSLNPSVSDPYAIVDAAPDGQFVLGGLDTAREWRVAALLDRNDDFEARDRSEVLALAPERIRFAEGEARARVEDFLVGTLDSTGTISGEVSADSADVVFVEAQTADPASIGGSTDSTGAVVEPDSSDAAALPAGTIVEPDSAAAWRTRALRDGARFELRVPTGALYRVFAFVDADGDSLPGAGERLVTRDEVISLRFTTTSSGLRFDLTSPLAEESLELLPAPPGEPARDAPADTATAGEASSTGIDGGEGP